MDETELNLLAKVAIGDHHRCAVRFVYGLIHVAADSFGEETLMTSTTTGQAESFISMSMSV